MRPFCDGRFPVTNLVGRLPLFVTYP